MDVQVAQQLTSTPGAHALAAALDQSDPNSLAAATALRREFPADLAAAALDQAAMRQSAVRKIGDVATTMLWTRDGLEQATRGDVSRWRAERLKAAGIRHVIDLGCACGADSRACLDAGLQVSAVEIDPATAELARHNLPGAQVLCADATAVLDELFAAVPQPPHDRVPGGLASRGVRPGGTAVMLDPARRTGRGRTWRLADVQPPWSFVEHVLQLAPCVVKLGPGVDRGQLPNQPVTHVGHRGDLVEATLWSGFGDLWPGDRAVLVDRSDDRGPVELPAALPAPEPGDLGAFLAEPHPAAIRAASLSAIAPGLRSVAPGIAYLTADEPVETPWLTWFAVEEVLPLDVRVLRGWVRKHRVGTVEIKKRGVDVDPVTWRRKLKPSGPNSATLVCTPTTAGARAVVCRRRMVTRD